jgi:hypothetical protein
MSREKEGYRPILTDLLNAKDERMWGQKEIALYLGLDPRTVKRRYGIGRGGIEVHELARLLAK